MNKNIICLWYNRDAEEAARFYAQTFPDSAVSAVHRAPSDYPDGKKNDVLTVEFTVCGIIDRGPATGENEKETAWLDIANLEVYGIVGVPISDGP